MFDIQMIDQLYETTRAAGTTFAWWLFDKRFLLDLPQATDGVFKETGESVSVLQLQQLAARGWLPILPSKDLGGAPGVPIYAPSRVGLLLKLERKGYTDRELRDFAKWEEWFIDNVITQDDLAYLDDELETVVRFLSDLTEAHQSDTFSADREALAAKHRRLLATLRVWQRDGVSPENEPLLDKLAFRARAVNDLIRVTMMEQERAKFRAGYSPIVQFNGWSCGPHEDGEGVQFVGHGLRWPDTIRAALAQSDDTVPVLRVCEFRLEGEEIRQTRTLTPKEYAEAWERHALSQYLHAWSSIHGDRRCLHCLQPLQEAADQRKRYCDEKCRNAAKQRRWREQNPEAVYRAQQKYWSSLDDD